MYKNSTITANSYITMWEEKVAEDPEVRLCVTRWETAVTTIFRHQNLDTSFLALDDQQQEFVATEYYELINGARAHRATWTLTAGQFRAALVVSLARGLEPFFLIESGKTEAPAKKGRP